MGLEDYGVETAAGEFLGKVKTVLRRGEDTYVVVESGVPLARTLHAVPWSEVADVDHGAVTVRLGRPPAELGSALELDPGKAIEGEGAEAVRVTDVPGQRAYASDPEAPGPVDRPTYAGLLVLALLGVFSALVLALFATTTDFTWQFALFVVPAILLGAAGVLAYRFFRRPSGPV
ncbi:MAG TPA: hypothetical protein VE644_07720 [Gaiellaceae bacterium]|jgi:hypothetical protein|nr:hypothetical protein [Gaiellaceae bacterium]